MADDIVQTIKIEVEGAEESAALLEKVGESATSSFEETQKAAETAGVSIEDFGKLSEKTQQAYIDLSQRVQESSREMAQATQELQQGAGEAGKGTRDLGGGLDDVSEKSGVSSREMRGLGKIMKELGAGEAAGLAVSFGKVASSLGALGAAALALAMVTGALVKFARDAKEAADALEKLAQFGGSSFESLKELEGIFERTGLSVKKFTETFTSMTEKILTEAPKIAQAIAESQLAAEKAAQAPGVEGSLRGEGESNVTKETATQISLLEKQTQQREQQLRSIGLQENALKLSTQQMGFQNQQLELQNQQLDLSLQKNQQQLDVLDRQQASQRAQLSLQIQSAGLATQDAEANLKKLEIKRAVHLGLISEATAQRQLAQIEMQSEDRAIKKAKAEVENAKLRESQLRQEQQQLKTKQEEERKSLEIQQQTLKLQQEMLPLQQAQLKQQRAQMAQQKEQLALQKELLTLQIARAREEAAEKSKKQALEEIERMIKLRELDVQTAANQAKANEALANSLGPVIQKYRDMAKGIPRTFSGLTTLETHTKALIAVMAQLGLSAEDMAKGFDGAAPAFEKILPALARMYDAANGLQKLRLDEVLKKAGFPPEVIKALHDGTEGLAKFRAEAAKIKWAKDQIDDFSKSASIFGTKMKDLSIIAAGIGIIALKAVGAIEHAVIDPLLSFFSTLFSGGSVETAVLAAVVSLGRVLHAAIDPLLAQFKTEIDTWVTTPVANAWQWIADTFNSAVAWVRGKVDEVKALIAEWVTTPVKNAWQWVKDVWKDIVVWIKTKIDEAKAFIAAWVTTPVANAWQWIVDTWNSIGSTISTKLGEAKQLITAWVTTPVANAWQWIKDAWDAMVAKLFGKGGGTPAPAEAGGAGLAGGGLLGGRGSGTSDSNLAWVSRGEHIMPARAVAQPGVLAFLEALRRSGGNLRDVLDGMGRFALGGMVRAPLAIPAFAGGGMNAVTIQFPGLPEITGLRASSDVVDQLRKAAALAQVRSGGRKPSRYS